MQALARYGFLTPERTVLDYGCGQGDDVAILKEASVPASGWDPHYSPDSGAQMTWRLSDAGTEACATDATGGAGLRAGRDAGAKSSEPRYDTPLEPAEIVNLGFVLNVIEEPAERRETLAKAFDLAQRCLAVAVLIVGKGDTTGLAPYRDGFMTRRETFQKYFRQEEAKELIEATLSTEAIPVGPGVFFVFKDRLSEQEFLLERQARRLDASLLAVRRRSERHVARRQVALERLRPLLERLWDQTLQLGREPVLEDLPADLATAVAKEIGSIRKGLKLCASLFDLAEFEHAFANRREDLLVYFALNLFNRRTRYSSMPKGLQRDVKAHFGGHRQAQDAATALLFDVGKPEMVSRACEEAVSKGLGHLEEGHLQLHADLISRLPPVLRCYVGCAAQLCGDVTHADLVKIHTRSGKLTLLSYDGFERPVPKLRERIKIDMHSLGIRFFDYQEQVPAQLLYLKSRYLAPDQKGFDAQRVFDDALRKTGIFDFTGFGPPGDQFEQALADAGYAIRGTKLIKRRKRPM
ncbi:MAG: DNA phosphorothioation-associated putative methyltransferase [Candidatus Sericytochromatia bacterium]|nr:DNA phosphorothioation-associated putative methyltransferase [Candidatus Tanganyikabacteria bacterium]